MEENGSVFSSVLTGNGMVGRIKSHLRCLILIPAHFGKKEEAGLRGHSGLQGNVDGVLLIKFWKDSGALSIYAHKIKDAPDNFHVYCKIPQVGSKAVPVPERIEEAEFKALTKGRKPVGDEEAEEEVSVEDQLLQVLRGLGDDGATVEGWAAAAGKSRQTISKYKKVFLADGRVEQISGALIPHLGVALNWLYNERGSVHGPSRESRCLSPRSRPGIGNPYTLQIPQLPV